MKRTIKVSFDVRVDEEDFIKWFKEGDWWDVENGEELETLKDILDYSMDGDTYCLMRTIEEYTDGYEGVSNFTARKVK